MSVSVGCVSGNFLNDILMTSYACSSCGRTVYPIITNIEVSKAATTVGLIVKKNSIRGKGNHIIKENVCDNCCKPIRTKRR